MKNMNDKGNMSVREAGQKGGEQTSKTHGKEFYEEIGRQGGEARARELGHEGYQELGRMGGGRVSELVRKGKEMEE